MKSKILCIEDDEDTCLLLKFVFEEEGYQLITCDSAEAGLVEARKGNFKAIILDNWFRGTSGSEICQQFRSFDAETPIIFFSGEARQREIDKALKAGANAYLIKPNDFERLADTVINLIRK